MKTEFEKIGVLVIRPFQKNGRWLFVKDNKEYDMAPAEIMNVILSPVIVGVDRLINAGCALKGISNPQNGFLLLVSTEYFPGCDVKLTYKETKFDGWIYDISSENLDIPIGQSSWICPYMTIYYSKPPKILYIKMETDNGL